MYYNISAGIGGFLPAVKQIANVAALPGIVGVSYTCIMLAIILGVFR